MNALDTPERSEIGPHEGHGLDADAWFAALDSRAIEMGSDTCFAQVVGIHASAGGLWIQLSRVDDPDMSVVLVVTATTGVDDVLHRLRTNPPTGHPLEVIHVEGSGPRPAAPVLQPLPVPQSATRSMTRASARLSH